MTKEYTGKDIKVLSDFEHVRLRTNVYLGNTTKAKYIIPVFDQQNIIFEEVEFIPAVLKSVGEIIDNSVDEHTQIEKTNKWIKIYAYPEEGRYIIEDNGRGVPIDKHETGKYTPEVVFGSLRSGRNFKNEKTAGVIGANGVGSSCVVACSTNFSVEIRRDGKVYKQQFTNGGSVISKPRIIEKQLKDTGTRIEFTLDNTVFENVSLPAILLRNKAIEVAFNNPNITVYYNDEKFKFKNGLEDLVKTFSSSYFKFGKPGFEFYVVFDVLNSIDEYVFTWVNSSLLYDGGICNTQFMNAFTDIVIEHLKKDAKKLGAEVTKNDIRQNLLVFGCLKISDPMYDSQSKTRLTGPNLRKEIENVLSMDWSSFVRKNKQWLETVLERANERHHKDANEKAIKEHKKTLKKKIPGLLDAVGKDRMKCKLFVTEGLCMKENTHIRVLGDMGFIDKSLKDVKVGDLVLTHKNRLKPIISKTYIVKPSIVINTKNEQIIVSEKHRLLVYEIESKQFKWLEANLIDKTKHKLVKSRLSNFEYVSQIQKIRKTDDPYFVYEIIFEHGQESVVCSKTHTFIVFDINDAQVKELNVEEINPLIHGIVMFSDFI